MTAKNIRFERTENSSSLRIRGLNDHALYSNFDADRINVEILNRDGQKHRCKNIQI